MNIKLLKEVARQLKAHPDVYNQDHFGVIGSAAADSCGTACCIAGMVVLLENPIDFNRWTMEDGGSENISNYARKLLKINKRQQHQLFSLAEIWPEPFRTDYTSARNAKERAAVGVRRINHFIKTGE